MQARLKIAIALAAVIAAGLATRSGHPLVPAFVARFGGDTLWATALWLALRLVAPSARRLPLVAIAAGTSLAVELSQLSDAAWLEAIRSTRLGVLLIGNGFLASDLLCYAVGIALAAGVDRLLLPGEPR